MKNTNFLIAALMFCFFNSCFSQEQSKSIPCWESKRIFDQVIGNNELIFEGRILTDSVYYDAPIVCTFHKVLVLKKFKGIFKSDTILVGSRGGSMVVEGSFQGDEPYATKGMEAVFCVSLICYKRLDHQVYFICDGDKCGFITVCDKKDVVKEVYEPIEKATGTPRIILRKNSCEK